jgi:hypothetical protein
MSLMFFNYSLEWGISWLFPSLPVCHAHPNGDPGHSSLLFLYSDSNESSNYFTHCCFIFCLLRYVVGLISFEMCENVYKHIWIDSIILFWDHSIAISVYFFILACILFHWMSSIFLGFLSCSREMLIVFKKSNSLDNC